MFYQIVLIALAILNVYTFFLMAWDKRKAGKKGWRVPEKRFFTLAAIGGSLGVVLAMTVWRHKVSKFSFYAPVYAITLFQIIALGWVWRH